MKKKAVFIINPVSGLKLAKKYLADILTMFANNDYECICQMTRFRGDAISLANEYADKTDMIVCVGGDGTLTEVANGLIKSGTGTPIGYIPSGSTNDFANSMKIPRDIMQAARGIIEGTPYLYDVGSFNDRYFTYIASFGAFTRASYATSQSLKNVLGHMAYILEGVRELSTMKSEHVRIELDDGTKFDDYYLFGGFCNSTSIGGILTLDPKVVNMSDGLFELLLIRAPRNTAELTECIRVLHEQDYKSSVFGIYSASAATLTTDYPINWSLDGEHVQTCGKVELKNVHNALRIIKA